MVNPGVTEQKINFKNSLMFLFTSALLKESNPRFLAYREISVLNEAVILFI